MNDAEEIKIEEEDLNDDQENEETEERDWSEEFKVASDELVETVKKLFHEAGVRRIVVKTKEDRVLLELPVVLGIAGIIILPAALSAVALIAAVITECSIIVERAEKEPEVEEAEA
jgi:hypothetical protein